MQTVLTSASLGLWEISGRSHSRPYGPMLYRIQPYSRTRASRTISPQLLGQIEEWIRIINMNNEWESVEWSIRRDAESLRAVFWMLAVEISNTKHFSVTSVATSITSLITTSITSITISISATTSITTSDTSVATSAVPAEYFWVDSKSEAVSPRPHALALIQGQGLHGLGGVWRGGVGWGEEWQD